MSTVRLPAEIWREVIASATHVPGLLQTTWYHDLDDQLWHGWRPIKDMAIATKLAITSVCREWRVLGIEFLYEAIQIPQANGPSKIKTLLAALPVSEEAPSSTSQLGYGWWIKRLEFPIEVFYPENFEDLKSLLHNDNPTRDSRRRYPPSARLHS